MFIECHINNVSDLGESNIVVSDTEHTVVSQDISHYILTTRHLNPILHEFLGLCLH